MTQGRIPVCLCLTGKTIEENLRALDPYRKKVDMVELRADCLDPSEKFRLRSFPELAGLPCLLTVRRKSDGGNFTEGEGVRLVMIAKALSFARADARANFAYVDLEDDFHMQAIEEACRTFGTRIIRSRHYCSGMPSDLDAAWEPLARDEDEIPKLAVTPQNSSDLCRLLAWIRTLPGRDRIVLGMGEFGVPTRILAKRLGSLLTYVCAADHDLPPAAPGQIDADTLLDRYCVHDIKEDTTIYALLGGKSILGSFSPMLHNKAFEAAGKDARMFPMPSDSAADALAAMSRLGARGAAITVPLKEEVLPLLSFQSTDVQKIGACNTIVRKDGGWAGYNTDADGFERSFLEFLGRKDLKGLKATLVGAGGAAKAVALALYRSGASCVILNRTIATARDLARKYSFAWAALDDKAIDLVAEYSDLIIQATSVGMAGGPQGDPLAFYEFNGREAVFDLIYRPKMTTFLERAKAAGCRTEGGYKMLCYQAAGQYRVWTREEPPHTYF